jgi:predicted PolB exonuclease-like 3'-5' exonuclease
LIAEQVDGAWQVRSLGAPHTGDRSEGELIASFVDRIAELRPQLVTFNGSAFDLPVLRYRAMVNTVSAPGLAARAYFHRYSEDAVDLCDCLGSFTSNAKVKLHELCRALGLPGKPGEIDGSKVDEYVRADRLREVSAYCECDIVSTYRVWLRYELFRGMLSRSEFEASEDNLLGYLSERLAVKSHLSHVLDTLHKLPSTEQPARQAVDA